MRLYSLHQFTMSAWSVMRLQGLHGCVSLIFLLFSIGRCVQCERETYYFTILRALVAVEITSVTIAHSVIISSVPVQLSTKQIPESIMNSSSC